MKAMEDRKVGEFERPRFIHLGWEKGTRQARGRMKHGGVITIAYRVDYRTGDLVLGMAFCSPGDQFSRKVGRRLALERMRCFPTRYVFPTPCDKTAIFLGINRVLWHRLEAGVPSWAGDFLRRWLTPGTREDLPRLKTIEPPPIPFGYDMAVKNLLEPFVMELPPCPNPL